jgi:hypothetical protein
MMLLDRPWMPLLLVVLAVLGLLLACGDLHLRMGSPVRLVQGAAMLII